MICIIDYGVGNLFSLTSSLKFIGADSVVSSDPEVIKRSDKIILPGVGAFSDARKKLSVGGLDMLVKAETERGKKLLGICLGMQMLFEKSYEYGEHEGLSILKGNIVSMKDTLNADVKIPHMGWNGLHIVKTHPIFKYVNENDFVYFVHSFYAEGCDDSLLATAEYSKPITAAVARDNVCGTQFHPEKSGEVGLSILRAFNEWE
jgi:glutamine amidotransferase